VNDLDLVFTNEVRDLDRTQDPKRMSDRDVKDIFVWEKRETMLPVARWPKRDEHVVTARVQASTEIDEMSLGAAVMSSG
jgi:hypothetical protein